jgi:hypothetical protein
MHSLAQLHYTITLLQIIFSLLDPLNFFQSSLISQKRLLIRFYIDYTAILNFVKLKSNGDLVATQIQKILRLIVRNLLLNLCVQKEFLIGYVLLLTRDL